MVILLLKINIRMISYGIERLKMKIYLSENCDKRNKTSKNKCCEFIYFGGYKFSWMKYNLHYLGYLILWFW